MLYGELPEIQLGEQKVRGVRVRVPGSEKFAVLGLPTSSQMIDRLNQQKSIRTGLGRRKSQTEAVPNPKADLALFQAIRQDKAGEAFDEWEAANAIRKLTACDVTDCVREGGCYLITLKTPFGDLKHRLKIPTQKDLSLYRRNIVAAVELPHNQEEIHYRTDAAVSLYDAVHDTHEGYVDSLSLAEIPPHHKFAAVAELVQVLEELDVEIDPNS